MKSYVDLPAAAVSGNEADALSPELVLVDPVLARTARERLPDSGNLALVRLNRAGEEPPTRFPDQADQSLRHRGSRRLLIGVAAVTILVLLLLDVRVELGTPGRGGGARAVECKCQSAAGRHPSTPYATGDGFRPSRQDPSPPAAVRVGACGRRGRLPRRAVPGDDTRVQRNDQTPSTHRAGALDACRYAALVDAWRIPLVRLGHRLG